MTHSSHPSTIAALLDAHRTGAASPETTIAACYARIRAHDDPAIFITLRDEAGARDEAKALAANGNTALPLYGVPVAIKDNIDVKGMPTTAACPDFAYQATKDATCVARLRGAGAIVVGKTNLDQFATGLVGVRSPYGVPKNVFNPALIPGGSSSGSAVAVGAGLVPLALGTDTAGSGRVPAGLSNIVGLKPSLGLVSRSRSTMRSPHSRCWPGPTPPTPIRGRAPSARSAPSPPASGSACRCRAKGYSSVTRHRPLPMKPRWPASPRSARALSRSTSSPSTKPRGCFTRGRGSPSATSPCAS
jgi:hypothetical protein